MVQGFKTKNSIYYVDTVNLLMWGGKLGDTPRRIAPGARFIAGMPGIAYFVDNNGNQLYSMDGSPAMIITGKIISYIRP